MSLEQRRIGIALIGLILGALSGIGAESGSLLGLPAFVERGIWGAVIGYVLGDAPAEEWRRIGGALAIGCVVVLGDALFTGPFSVSAVATNLFIVFVCALLVKNWVWRGALGALISGALAGAFIGLLFGLSLHMTGLDLLKGIVALAVCMAVLQLILSGLFGFKAPSGRKAGRDSAAAKIHAWTNVLILDRENSEAYYKRGLLYAQQGEIELARADFHRAHESSGDPRWHALAAQALRDLEGRSGAEA